MNLLSALQLNWVDIFIITIVLRTSYTGYSRGLLNEFFGLLGLLAISVLSVYYGSMVMDWVSGQFNLRLPIFNWLVFWVLFLVLVFAIRRLVKRLVSFLKWDSLTWFTQWTGLILGAVRGLWWAGVCLVILASSGWSYPQDSVEQRSLCGPTVIAVWRQGIARIVEHLPSSSADTTFPPTVVIEGQRAS